MARRRGRLVAVEGGSGAGKTTLVRAAHEAFGWEPLAEAFDRLDPAPSLEYRSSQELLRLEGTLLAEEERRYREGERSCAEGRTVVADTAFFGPLTYTWGLVGLGRAPRSVATSITRAARALVRQRTLGLPDLVVFLDTTARVRSARARSDRAHHPHSLFLRHESVGRLERRYYEELLPTVLPDRVQRLDGRLPPERLAVALRETVDRARWGPPASRDALAAIRLLPSLVEGARHSRGRPNR